MRTTNRLGFAHWMAVGLLALGLAIPQLSSANHPVKVEGDTDVDGDGRVGQAEDTDGPAGDPQGLTFGTIAGCLGGMNGGISQNGSCLIVSSGSFAETINITNQVTIEAAPGVVANIEAFLVPADARLAEFPSAAMDAFSAQGDPGIVINSPANRQVILRNLVITNWTDGVRIMGNSHVLMDNVRIDHNINNGVVVMGSSAVVGIRNSQITSTGFRVNPRTGDFPTMMMPNPGIGVNVMTRGPRVLVMDTLIAGSAGVAVQGVNGATSNNNRNMIFDNERADDLRMQR